MTSYCISIVKKNLPHLDKIHFMSENIYFVVTSYPLTRRAKKASGYMCRRFKKGKSCFKSA